MSVFDTSVRTDSTLPTWFTDAQKASVATGKSVYDAATPFSGTVGATMSKDLFGTPSQPNMPSGANSMVDGSGMPTGGSLPSNNPFMTAMGTLNTVASNAANPFLDNGGFNTDTALGGLFAAQNSKLDQILPQIAAQTGAGGIGGGNYGGLRGQTAVNTARAGALTTLAEQQHKAFLDAQNQAINAAKGVGDVGSQYSTSALNAADAAMNADINQFGKYSNIINAMGPNTDKSSVVTTKGSSYENLLKGLDVFKNTAGGLAQVPDWLKTILNTGGGSGNAGGDYGGDISQPGHWEGGEWVNDEP
jgi:hypothetical protein